MPPHISRRSTFLALMLCMPSLGQAQWTHPKPMTVVMIDNRFQPDHLTFQSGKPYALNLVNRGREMHEFTAPEFLKASRVRDTRALTNGGTDIVVQPGQSVRFTLIPRQKGQFKLICADHDWDGMVGTIEVR
jgi:uncharacterized cupredoxin-like copper-binding protein